MSTSPSWFDQEKFSRLVKKVGPKTGAEPIPTPSSSPTANELEERPISGEGLASTARISLVSKPPSLSENRALPALPRRTSTLPSLKALFPQPTPTQPSPLANPPPAETFLGGDETKENAVASPSEAPETHSDSSFGEDEGPLSEVWQKMSQLNEELARAIQERDQALHDCDILRGQLDQAEKPKEPKADLRSATQSQELTLLTDERDQARKQYSALRKEFETLKQEQTPKEESGRARKELEQQLEGFRQKLEERNKELAALKANSTGFDASGGGGDEKLQEQIIQLREQVSRAKDEASVAQRGLALSQKALHETRDTLREATEGTSLSRHNFDNLKNECATLTQQNAVLQAQNDQLTRDLAAAKSKLTTRL